MPECSTCGAPATQVWRRQTIAEEAEAHWDAREAFRRAGRHPEPGYVQDRTGDVDAPVYGCDAHQMPEDKAHLLHDAGCAGPGDCGCDTQDAPTEAAD